MLVLERIALYFPQHEPRRRSGTFVLVDTCLLEAELSGTQAVNVKERLLDMRTYR